MKMCKGLELKYGLLESKFLDFFNGINERSFCRECQISRKQFIDKDQKHNHCYSNLLVGFSGPNIDIPLDILIIGQAHGGDKRFFRSQKSLNEEVIEIGNFYLNERLSTFHQYKMRELFNWLNQKKKTWVFTDLLKCFVWYGKKDKKRRLKGEDNIRGAIKHCKKYLDEEISFLRPKKILCLGTRVLNNYFEIRKKLKHGEQYRVKINDFDCNITWSYFPGGRTADKWIEAGQWEKIFQNLKNL